MIVESSVGSSEFTEDPSRHKIVEATITVPPSTGPAYILPDRHAASVLVEAYFINVSIFDFFIDLRLMTYSSVKTCGLVEVLDRKAFENVVAACYDDPLSVDAPSLCLVYLALAIGLVMATSVPDSLEDAVVKPIRADPVNRAEVFFRSAKSLGDQVSGFEDADFWSVQALSLMSVYMLATSKRNAAYAYCGRFFT